MKEKIFSNLEHLLHIKFIPEELIYRYKVIPATKEKWYKKAKPELLLDTRDGVSIDMPSEDWFRENNLRINENKEIFNLAKLILWFKSDDSPLIISKKAMNLH